MPLLCIVTLNKHSENTDAGRTYEGKWTRVNKAFSFFLLSLLLQKWKKVWLSLYSQSSQSVARLEYCEYKEGSTMSERQSSKRMDRKLIRMSECISIFEVVSENYPKESGVFAVETTTKMYTFATDKSDCIEWVQKLKETTFEVSVWSWEICPTFHPTLVKLNDYTVTVRSTDASERCELSGMYFLTLDKEVLMLKNIVSEEVVYEWPYRYLRRFGGDTRIFSFESGRSSKSGPGKFEFETKHGKQIVCSVNAAVKIQRENSDEERNHFDSLENDNSLTVESATYKPHSGSPQSVSKLSEMCRYPKEHKYQLSKKIPSAVSKLSTETMENRTMFHSKPSSRGANLTETKEPIYDEVASQNDFSLYDEAKVLTEAWKVQGTVNDSFGYEYPYNSIADDYAVPKQVFMDGPPRPRKKGPGAECPTSNGGAGSAGDLIASVSDLGGSAQADMGLEGQRGARSWRALKG
uniref:IRS-type PTB domain-containing protein n=1 Tax=Callorhinchus milii TaxID=7868 RepID=A0A4W3J510_CALMI